MKRIARPYGPRVPGAGPRSSVIRLGDCTREKQTYGFSKVQTRALCQFFCCCFKPQYVDHIRTGFELDVKSAPYLASMYLLLGIQAYQYVSTHTQPSITIVPFAYEVEKRNVDERIAIYTLTCTRTYKEGAKLCEWLSQWVTRSIRLTRAANVNRFNEFVDFPSESSKREKLRSKGLVVSKIDQTSLLHRLRNVVFIALKPISLDRKKKRWEARFFFFFFSSLSLIQGRREKGA